MKGRIFGGVKPSPHSGNGSISTNGSSSISRFGGYSYPFHYSNMFPSNNTTRQRPPPPSIILPQPPRSRQSSYISTSSSNCGPARLYYYALMTTVASVIVIQLTLIVLWHPHFLLMQEQQHHLSGFPDHPNIPPLKGNDKSTTKSTAVRIDGTHSDSSTVTTTRITKKNDDSDSLPGDVTMQVPMTDKGTEHRRIKSRTTTTVRSNSTVLSNDKNNSNNAPVSMDKKDEKNARSSTAIGAKGGVFDSMNHDASFEDGNAAVRVPRNESSSLSNPTKMTRANNGGESDSMTTASSISNMTTTLVVDNTLGHATKKENDVQQRHTHIIPNHVIFTHYVNLLETPEDILNEKYNEEDISLKANVLNTISLHPGAKVSFLTDKECVQAIEDAMRDIHSDGSTSSHQNTATTTNNTTTSTPLVKYFLKEPQGMYKADICRGAALYNIGGLYFDVDIQARMNIFSVIKPTIEFVTPTVHRKSNWLGSFFQAFIGITPRHPIMKHYLNLFVQHYDGTSRVTKGPLGVILLRRAYDIWKEESKKQGNGNTTSKEPSSVILWEETKYNKERFPDVEPTVGKRRACHFLVAIPGTSTAVFYSRVRGSRMCGGKESIAVHNEEDKGKTKDATKTKGGKTTKRDTTTKLLPESESVATT